MFQPLYIFLAIILNFLVLLVAIYLIEKKIKDVEKTNDIPRPSKPYEIP